MRTRLPGFSAQTSLNKDVVYRGSRIYSYQHNEIVPQLKPVSRCYIRFGFVAGACGLTGPAATLCITGAGIDLLMCVDEATEGGF
jgi:hypothetical protein